MRRIAIAGALLAGSLMAAASAHAKGLSFSSPDVPAKSVIKMEQVANSFGCTGGNVSPALSWSGAPANTKSFAITVYDPDAPTGSGFWHWVVFNIPANTTSIPKGAGDPKSNLMPAGAVQSRTDFGVPGYNGPCPPEHDKAHRYRFTLFAVDIDKIDANADTPAAVIGFNLHFHTIAKKTFVATYGR